MTKINTPALEPIDETVEWGKKINENNVKTK